ncbi:MAG: cupredoxin domain-containing protein [Parcubacteria group bacterium]|nr:cupredoxin domain-containing protein [Parcubacteria group bacterium]
MENKNYSQGYGKRPLWQWMVIYVIVGAVVYGLIYYFFFSGSGGYSPSTSQNSPYAPTYQTPPAAPTPSGQPTAGTSAPAPKENAVIYTASGFSPAALTVKAGETVVFKNESSNPMWAASGVHPTHTLYPTTGGCIGSTFDACKGIAPGDSWSFTFDVKGTWPYHDHLNAQKTGKIVVE